MKVLFVLRHAGLVRNFEEALGTLALRGHKVVLGFESWERSPETTMPLRLADDFKNIDLVELPGGSWSWLHTARQIRGIQDYLRYFDPAFANAAGLRERAIDKTVGRDLVHRINRLHRAAGGVGISILDRILKAGERAIPTDPQIDDFLKTVSPDVLLVAPLVNFRSDQVDYIKSARRLGIPSVLPVVSWDNLTNKGRVRVTPDKVFVWNKAQEREAVAFHDMDRSDVVVTGAQPYDHWYTTSPSRDRAGFCEQIGLDPAHPYILYACSSPSIAAGRENEFVRDWLSALRSSSHETVRKAGVVVRPHPQNLKIWWDDDLQDNDNVVVFPKAAVNPIDATARTDFFDTMVHCSAVVGINTSAQIESAVVGRPVLTIESEDFRSSQVETLHYHHLVDHGLLVRAQNFDKHVEQLSGLLSDSAEAQLKSRKFVEEFIRPFGLESPSTPRFVDAVEAAAKIKRRADDRKHGWGIARGLVRAVAKRSPVASRPAGELYTKNTRKTWTKGEEKTLSFEPLVKREVNSVKTAISKATKKSSNGVIFGPWSSEIGFELLYWIPFLRKIAKENKISQDRIAIMSRGNTQLWYRDFADTYLDLFDFMDEREVDEMVTRRTSTGGLKHDRWTDHDQMLLHLAGKSVGAPGARHIHPMLMYRMFRPYWSGMMPNAMLNQFLDFEMMPKPDRGDIGNGLPDRYAVVRFYSRASFPDNEDTRNFVARTIADLAERIDVVVLGPHLQIDDHRDFPIQSLPNVHYIGEDFPVRENLDLQTRIIANAEIFIGTYGGISYLAPFHGVPSVSFFTHDSQFQRSHLEVAQRCFEQFGVNYTVLSIDQWSDVRGIISR